jgi:signal transduction histidine kinase
VDIGQLTQQDMELFKKIEAESNPKHIHNLVTELILLSDDKSPLSLLEVAKLLFELSQKKNDAFSESVAMSLYGQGYRITGDFTKSQQYHFKAIELAKKLSDKSLIAFALNQSAHIYKDRAENEKAIAIYKESNEFANNGTDPFFRFYPIMNLGFVYLQVDKADSALYYASKSVSMMEEILAKADAKRRAILERSLYEYCLLNLAAAYSKSKDKKNADKYYEKAMVMMEKYRGIKSRYFQYLFYHLAQHYQRYDITDSALYAARMAIESGYNTPLEYLSARPAKMLSDHYESRNADSTVKYLKIYLKANEVMNSTRVTQQLQMKTVEEEQRNLEIQRAQKAYRDKVLVYLLVGGLVAMLLLALYMYRSGRQRKRMNTELQKQKAQVEKTLAELKSTQVQLVQSEKMASLGELTAGIAHEIQNPLNFVNNFSDINTDLLKELKDELQKDNKHEALLLAEDIIENEQKICEHGKRADAIVKGMLQHSRTISGQREATDINALADEYLRLSYHGLKAKDKTFNATLQTDFDESIGKIYIIPQEIGRVLLNLYSNAFYAVAENKKQQKGEDYEPIVSVCTKRLNGKLEIRVKDNGNGIPPKVLDKIFQPFFTTKPAGQGTGLGLSMSYDIIKAHGGEIKVETKEGEGSEFIISIPTNHS